MKWAVTIAVCAVCFATTILAKEKPTIQIEVQEKKEARKDVTAHTQVIIPSEVVGIAETVSKLLERAAGVQIRRYGGLDDFAAVSIRGSTTDQVLIYLDGVLLNTSQGGVLDLSLIPIDQIERIEIYRGGSPGKIVDSTPGGVIYIVTKGKAAKTENNFRALAGSFYTFRASAQRRESFKNFYYNALFDHFRSQGDFAYLDDRGTRNNTNDDRVIHRINNDFQNYDFFATLGEEKESALNWKIDENFFIKEQGVAGLGSRTSSSARLKTLRNFFHGQLATPQKQKVPWQAHLFFDFIKSQFDDSLGEIGLGTQDNDDETFRFGPQFSLTYPIGNHLLNGFIAHRGEFFWPKNNLATNKEGPMSQRHMISIGAEDEMVFFDDRLIVAPSLRLQNFINHLNARDPSFANQGVDNNVVDTQLSSKLGIKYSPLSFLSLKSNFYRGFRQPTFAELFGDRGILVGNPELSPESALNFDFGWMLHEKELGFLDSISAETTFFRQDINHLIQFLQTSQFNAQAQNLNSALIWGGELAVAIQAFKNLRFSANYVYQNAKDNAKNSPTYQNTLPGRPRHQIFLETDYKYRFVKPFLEIQILSHNFLDSQNLLRVNQRTLLALGIEFFPRKNIDLTFATRNLLNNRIVDIAGFPLPGRVFTGELELRL